MHPYITLELLNQRTSELRSAARKAQLAKNARKPRRHRRKRRDEDDRSTVTDAFPMAPIPDPWT